jgi:hypothetical protein
VESPDSPGIVSFGGDLIGMERGSKTAGVWCGILQPGIHKKSKIRMIFKGKKLRDRLKVTLMN